MPLKLSDILTYYSPGAINNRHSDELSDDPLDCLNNSSLSIKKDASDETRAELVQERQYTSSFSFERIFLADILPPDYTPVPSTPNSGPSKKCGAMTKFNRPCNITLPKNKDRCRFHPNTSPTPQRTVASFDNDSEISCAAVITVFFSISSFRVYPLGSADNTKSEKGSGKGDEGDNNGSEGWLHLCRRDN